MSTIYIGYDSRESICYDICKKSITDTCVDETLEVKGIKLHDLKNIYQRDHDPLAATEFTYTRFLVPYLNNYTGWALFCDCDFIFLDDVSKLFDLRDTDKAIMVCKHDYKPTNTTKMDDKIQSVYPRKNWSSLILWNCSHPSNRNITPDIVNNQTGKFLHRFEWLDDTEIGSIPVTWNWLVNWYQEPEDGHPHALHFTEGGPWFDRWSESVYDSQWIKYRDKVSEIS
jgi:lipopolysaccharide biosynthesis glycosyltransferase